MDFLYLSKAIILQVIVFSLDDVVDVSIEDIVHLNIYLLYKRPRVASFRFILNWVILIRNHEVFLVVVIVGGFPTFLQLVYTAIHTETTTFNIIGLKC